MQQSFSKETGDAHFAQDYSKSIEGIGATRAALGRLLRSLDLVGWSRREESGRVDRRAYSRYAAGQSNIFSRRTYKEADTAAVSIMIDCSGSMDANSKIIRAQEVGIQLAKMLEQAKVNYAVRGFFGYSMVHGDDKWGVGDQVYLYPLKNWNESLQKARAKLGSLDYFVQGGTPDYGALYVSVEELSKMSENRKVLFVITDAEGFDARNIAHIHKIAVNVGVKIIAIGVQSDEVKEVFENAVSVDNVNDLGGASFKILLNELRK